MQTRLPSGSTQKSTQKSALKEPLGEKTFRQLIRGMGIKVTDQRVLLLKIIHESRAHFSAQEVYERVMEIDTTIGFATVYRFLRHLAEKSYLTEVRVGANSTRYEIKTGGHHDHLSCTQCGKICEFENDKIESLQVAIAKQFGFQLTSHVLELYGICADCQRRESASR